MADFPVDSDGSSLTARVAGVAAGRRDLRILCLGDSTTRGTNRLVPHAGQAAQSYPAQLAPLLAARLGVKASAAAFIGTGNIRGGDARLSTDFQLRRAGLGREFFTADATASLSFDPGLAWDMAELHVVGSPGAAFTCQAGDGAAELFRIEPTGELRRLAFRTAPGTAPLRIAWSSGSVTVAGASCRLASEREITILNGAAAGGQASQFTGPHPCWGGLACIRHLAPDLTVIDFGINEFLHAVPIATYRQGIELLIDAARPTGAVLLKTFIPTGKSADGVPEQAYAEAMRDLAASHGLPLLDIHAEWGSYRQGKARGWYSDGKHGSAAGYAEVAGRVAEVIEALSRRPDGQA